MLSLQAMSAYEVLIKQDGRGGTIYYREGDAELDFWWEFSMSGATIGVPGPDQWDPVCENIPTFQGRRDEILERVAKDVCRQQRLAEKYAIGDSFLEIYF